MSCDNMGKEMQRHRTKPRVIRRTKKTCADSLHRALWRGQEQYWEEQRRRPGETGSFSKTRLKTYTNAIVFHLPTVGPKGSTTDVYEKHSRDNQQESMTRKHVCPPDHSPLLRYSPNAHMMSVRDRLDGP